MPDLIERLTAALRDGEDASALLTEAGDARGELEDCQSLIQSLEASFRPQEIRPDFEAELRRELLNGRGARVKRVRPTPARVRVAALLALAAGLLLLMLRRLFGSDAPQEISEEAVATPL